MLPLNDITTNIHFTNEKIHKISRNPYRIGKGAESLLTTNSGGDRRPPDEFARWLEQGIDSSILEILCSLSRIYIFHKYRITWKIGVSFIGFFIYNFKFGLIDVVHNTGYTDFTRQSILCMKSVATIIEISIFYRMYRNIIVHVSFLVFDLKTEI